MRKVLLDFQEKDTPEAIHQYIAQAMELPEYYGANLDALSDCLSDICDPTCIGVFGIDTDNDYMCALVDVLRDSEAANDNISVVFAQHHLNECE